MSMTRNFFQLNSCGNSPYVKPIATVSYQYAWIFVKSIFRTYNMLLAILPFVLQTSSLSVQALQNRSCLTYVSYAITAA
jgi:hypothetical protein